MNPSPTPMPDPANHPLNLFKFAPSAPEPDANQPEGPTLKVRRVAAEIADQSTSEVRDTRDEFSVPLPTMLGVITHCYARGVFCSKDIARLLQDEPALRRDFGSSIPKEDAIRRFRRRHAEQIEEALESLYRAYPGGGPDPTTPGAGESTRELRRQAVERLHDAAWADNTKGRIG